MSCRRVRQLIVPLFLGLLLLAAHAAFAQDTTPPEILSRETADLDGDGLIEAIHIIFSEPISDATVTAGDFNILTLTLEAFSSTTNGDTADDADIFITFKKSPAHQTDSTPSISYTAGTLTDLAGNPLASTGLVTSTDKAGPAVRSAVASDKALIQVGIDSDDTVTLTFSEATNKPVITSANIDTALRLNNGHTWLDGSGAIGAAGWSPTGDRLTITLSTATSLPTVAVGDTITLGGLITDVPGNACSAVAFSAISGTFSTDLIPPVIISGETADLNTDGFIDAVRLSFSEPVRDSTVTATDFSFSGGVTAVGFTTGAAADDAELFITFTDGVLGTDATPTVSYTAGTLKDMPGNLLQISSFPSTDGAAPRLMYTLAVVGEKSVFVRFSEPVNRSGSPLSPADFGGSIGGNTILYVVLADPRGGYADGVFLSLTNPLTYIDVLAPQNITLAGAAATDRKGLPAPGATHRVSDLLLGAVQPVWAANLTGAAQVGVTAKAFNGSETLDHRDVTVQARTLDLAVPAPAIYFDSNATQKTNGLWLPVAIPGLVANANGGVVGPLTDPAPIPPLYNYLLAESTLERGSLELVFQVGGLYSLRVLNPKDPRSLAMWTLNVQDQQSQRGQVTILDNVLRTGLGGKTTLVYTLVRRGSVTILVSDMRGDIVAVLVRAVQDAGQHAASWDGRNRAGRIVAPGLYYVKVVGPDINEVRKVLVGK